MRTFESTFRVRSYELDGLGHVNHAVFLNYFEQARFDALEHGGFPVAEMTRRGWGVHVVRIEVDYRRECRQGDRLEVRTRIESFRNSSVTIRQELRRRDRSIAGGVEPDAPAPRAPTGPGEVAAEATVVAVWIGEDGRPMRIPPEVRRALGEDTQA